MRIAFIIALILVALVVVPSAVLAAIAHIRMDQLDRR